MCVGDTTTLKYTPNISLSWVCYEHNKFKVQNAEMQ